ncbi:hypothetical protein T12_12558 [Trichinella patagoniensis]|uniref:Uncharacterized protein n=1 Tax=Trichinella patagoniensis TaxID=990121 RepID=A0A0V0Z7L0_9BILA|nr:hypothetical protein T12_12558 [Trichinella patagoniensis]
MRCRANVARSVESPSLLPLRYLLRPWKKWHPQGACQFLTFYARCKHSPPTPRCRCYGVGSPQTGGPSLPDVLRP